MNNFSVSCVAVVLMLVLAGRALAAPALETDTLSLPEALRQGLAQSPGLAASRAMALAARARVPQAGSLPDPRLNIGLANLPSDSFSLSQDPMSQIQVGISQALPFPGKRGLEEEVAEYHAEAARQGSDEARLALLRDIKQAWWGLFYFDRALETNANNRGLFEQQLETAQTRYTVGRGEQHDILLAQLELARLDDERLQLQQARGETEILLNRLLNRPPETAIHLPEQSAAALPLLSDMAQLQAVALNQRPDLFAAQARLEAARAQRALSARDQYPDFTLGAIYGRRDGRQDLASIQFSMSLPLYAGRKQSKAEDQRQAELIAAQEQLRDLHSRVSAAVASAVLRYRRARDQVTLFEQAILPQARQTVEAMLAGYQVNKTAFINLVQAQADLYDYETRYWRVYSAAHQALAELAAAIGEERMYE
ncbi:hypothetical protein Tel_03380 [Candidatus Tenderia electrophaga]|mgnify:CR=1 FL=1|jgi:outer membrane protein TolC|uniref:Transporter n=1 Tax=Candidatus Tenderia electrophaga TaxID=1748243 RepID=A0A0S2TAU3_9GAMM|nr:hypothetical protein Tel_03380 [Candidatus Tenderia electrophaga]